MLAARSETGQFTLLLVDGRDFGTSTSLPAQGGCIHSSSRALAGRKGRDHSLRRHHHWQRRGRRHPGHHLAPSGKKILLLELGGWMTRKTENWNAEEVFVNSQIVLAISLEPKRPQPS